MTPAGPVASHPKCYYCNYMKQNILKVTRIGNSRGVRLPAGSLRRYRIGESVIMEERTEGIMLKPAGRVEGKLSWRDTAREMAASGEDWSDLDPVENDGLANIPWEDVRSPRVASPSEIYNARRRSTGKK